MHPLSGRLCGLSRQLRLARRLLACGSSSSCAAAAGARPPLLLMRAAAASSSSSRRASVRAAAAEKQQQQQSPRPPRPLGDASEVFFADAAHSFTDLGVQAAVAEALQAAGFSRPSRVQELAVPAILSGCDVVLAAETGSGKTLAYIAPIASALLARRQAAAAAASTGDGAASSSSSRRQLALVLCPNTALCQQVVRLVASLPRPGGGGPLLRAAHVSSSNPPPFEPPDVVVTTPGALVTLFNDRGAAYGPQWAAEGVSGAAAFVVVDEADLLVGGGYARDLSRLLDALKAGERRLVEAQVMAELGLGEDEFGRLPRHIKQACWEGGAPGMIAAGFRAGGRRRPQQQQQQDEDAGSSSGEAGASAAAAAGGDDNAPSSSSSSSNDGSQQQQQQRGGSFGPYFRRQYLFVAATLPSLTKGDVGTELQRRFKSAVWVSGDLLHHVKPHVSHAWLRVGQPGSAGADQALLSAVTGDGDYAAGAARVLVFAKDTASADRVSAMLAAAGVPNMLYHKNVPLEQRDAALAAMAAAASPSAAGDGSANAVLVSTDAAARGIDLPLVTHVVQADFAATATDFLHRVGRTARAGRPGKVTSLYGPADAVLAEALQQYIEAGRPVEECFSRNRSFSKKVRKYGKFVPRGQQG